MDKPFVLVADDNEATCTLIAALLRHEFVVEPAYDGMAAVAKLKSRRYAAVILDLFMPQVDGFEVLDFLRAERPDLLPRTIVVTASIGRRDVDRVHGYGVCALLAKPFEVDVLQATVQKCAGEDDAFDGSSPLVTGMILLIADLLR
ncbi:MAG TPA: response regulator [Thermoanaerobaculia bacterium]|nr:response regulator [Thermoanaerobaculia bacterium]